MAILAWVPGGIPYDIAERSPKLFAKEVSAGGERVVVSSTVVVPEMANGSPS